MFSKLFTTVRVFYINCKHSRFFEFFRGKFEEIEQNRSLKALGIRKLSKTRVHFLIQFTYPLKRSHALVAWVDGKQRGLWSSRTVISIKHSRISGTTKDCVFDLIHDWLVFPVLWVSRLRRDLLIVILIFWPSNWSIVQMERRFTVLTL